VSAPVRPAYARYVLGLLLVVYVMNFVDRQILSILLDPIKQDLGVSDTAPFMVPVRDGVGASISWSRRPHAV